MREPPGSQFLNWTALSNFGNIFVQWKKILKGRRGECVVNVRGWRGDDIDCKGSEGGADGTGGRGVSQVQAHGSQHAGQPDGTQYTDDCGHPRK